MDCFSGFINLKMVGVKYLFSFLRCAANFDTHINKPGIMIYN